jgi:hypothetical protein
VVARSDWRGSASGSTRSATSIATNGEKIGRAFPAKIIRVWLIAVSLFQRTEGKCQYAGISFVTDEGVLPVL